MVLVIPQASLPLLLVVFGTEVKPAKISLLFVILLLFILVVAVVGLGLYTLPLSAGGGANKPLPPPPKVFPIVFFFNALLLLDWIFIWIFSPSFNVKSYFGSVGKIWADVAACFSLSHSLLNSLNDTLKSKASLRSLKAIPINACCPCAFLILNTKYLPLSNVLSTAVSSVTGHTANVFPLSSSNVIMAILPFDIIFNLPVQIGVVGQSDARCPSIIV